VWRVPVNGADAAPVLRADLAARVDALLAVGGRRLLGITGPPGAGKSTLAAAVHAYAPAASVVVPMDGFHLAQTSLERLGLADRKGAPDTFDAAGLVALLLRLRVAAGGGGGDDHGRDAAAAREDDDDRVSTVWAPEYRRDLRNGVAGAIAVPVDVPLVVVEGNYLLVDAFGFAPVAGLLDECWFVAPDDEVRRARLAARHEHFGKPAAAALAWTDGPDEANARLVAPTAARADLVVDPDAG
jgi:pantothenate kinase